MNRALRLLVLAVGATAFPCASTAGSLTEASSIYRRSFRSSPPAVYEGGAYLFVIVEDDEEKSRDGSINDIVLAGQLELLEKYIGGTNGNEISPFSAKVTEQLMPLAEFQFPDVRRYPVERRRTGGKFRDVTAFDLAPIKAERERVSSGKPIKRTFSDWRDLLCSKMETLSSSEERERFCSLLGATTMLTAGKGGVDCMGDRVDYAAIATVSATWSTTKADETMCTVILSVYPTFSPALRWLADRDAADGDFVRALVKAFKANAEKGDQVAYIASRFNVIVSRTGCLAWSELARLFADTQEKSEIFKNGDAIHKYALRTFGRMTARLSPQDDGGAFREAQTLFGQGKDLPKIIQLLGRAVSANPADAVAWRYYGAALRVAGKYFDAVIAYNEALTFNPKDSVAAMDVCTVYQKLGLTELASGNAWYEIVTSQDGKCVDKALGIVNENCKDVFGK